MTNPVLEAVRVLGGQLEDVAVVCRVSKQAVHRWVKAGRVLGARHAVLIARATALKGELIPVEQLAGFMESTTNGGNKKTSKGKRAWIREPAREISSEDSTSPISAFKPLAQRGTLLKAA